MYDFSISFCFVSVCSFGYLFLNNAKSRLGELCLRLCTICGSARQAPTALVKTVDSTGPQGAYCIGVEEAIKTNKYD